MSLPDAWASPVSKSISGPDGSWMRALLREPRSARSRTFRPSGAVSAAPHGLIPSPASHVRRLISSPDCTTRRVWFPDLGLARYRQSGTFLHNPEYAISAGTPSVIWMARSI